MTAREAPVLIVGGSLAGVTTAAFLAHHGVRPLVVERHRGTAIHPRAALVYQRTMEIVRSLGIEERVRRRSYQQFEPDGAIMSVETLGGEELNWDVAQLNEAVRDLSPSERLFVTQDALEPLLHERAVDLGAELRFGTEMETFEEDADGVTAVIRDRDTGATETVRAPYLVAADGGRSRIREALGVSMTGHGLLSQSLTIYFRGDVGPLMRGRNLSVILVRNQTFRGFFRIEKPYHSGFLIVHMLGDLDNPITNVWDLDEKRCVELIHAGLGTNEVPVTIDNIQRWECRADVAQTFRRGRIFLAGDSAHVMPPYGGFGGNAAIQDAHNLAWKLAFVVRGRAGERLLDTYEPERRPVDQLTVEQAYLRYVLRAALYLQNDQLPAFVPDPNIDLGYRYRSAAVLDADAARDDRVHMDPREARGRPGTRAPHVALHDHGHELSTQDLLGRSFVLMAGPRGARLCDTASRAAAHHGVSIDVHCVGGDGPADPDGRFSEVFGVEPSGGVLVRPDGFVAWRAKRSDEVTEDGFREVLASVLALSQRDPATPEQPRDHGRAYR